MKMLLQIFLLFGLIIAVGRAETDSEPVIYIDEAEMATAFAKGQRLITRETYNVSASRREKPGTAEVHETDTDIFYFIAGTATFVTGGELVEPRNTKPGEWRGPSTQGGTARIVAAGDVILVPKNTAHWFSKVEAPILYYIVKVTE